MWGFLEIGSAILIGWRSVAIAGQKHSIVVTSNGTVYSVGPNKSGQLGHATTEKQWSPCQIRSLQGICIIQAAIGDGRTMLISDAGEVYSFGKVLFGMTEYGIQEHKLVCSPQKVEYLKHIFVVQLLVGILHCCVIERRKGLYTSLGK